MTDPEPKALDNGAAPGPSDEVLDMRKALGRSWELFVADPVTHLVAALILTIGSMLSFGLLAPVLTVGYIRLIKRQIDGAPIEAAQVFQGFERFGPALITGLIMAIGVGVGFAFLVIPGVILAILWCFALHFVALGDADPLAALGSSWELVKGNTGSVLLLVLIGLAISFAGSLIIVGFLLTTPLFMILFTLSYLELSPRGGEERR